MNIKTAFLAMGLAALLAACGDNPEQADTTPPASNEVPASATASTRAYAQYAGSQAANDTAAPLDVTSVNPPTSESEEPQPI